MVSFSILGLIIALTSIVGILYSSTAWMLLVLMETIYFVLAFSFLLYRCYVIRADIRILPDIVQVQSEQQLQFSIQGQSIWFPVKIKACILIEDVAAKEAKKSWIELCDSQEEEQMFCKGLTFSEAGIYRVVLKKLKLYDITGMMHMNVKLNRQKRVVVMPVIREMAVFLTDTVRNYYGEADVYDDRRAGYDKNELFAIREYQAGDKLADIHWKLTAKEDKLMVKEYALPKPCAVLFLLELPAKSKTSRKQRTEFLEAACGISFSMLHAGCQHYVAWYDANTEEMIRVCVTEEESLFQCILMLMDGESVSLEVPLLERYTETYKTEPYVRTLLLNKKLQLKIDGELAAQLGEKGVGEAWSQLELCL